MRKKSTRYSALREVRAESAAEIDRKTAAKWASRAIAACRLYAETGDPKMLDRANDYRHEALEHAALVGNLGKFVAEIQGRVDPVFRKHGIRVEGGR